MKRALASSSRMKDEAFVLETCPVGPWGPVAVVGMLTVRTAGETSVLSVTG
ncbi:hypothetical protein SAMN05216338_11056 [Bradyrhizobium sp. Rc2d]|nr:hypothetical protein SAMN05216338_11056 [Bradyrhizobium sp. Rc2d]